MNRTLKRTLALAALSLVLVPLSGALSSQGSEVLLPLSNSQLDARHPASLCGRGATMQTGYVDLYAPLSEKEAQGVAGYRAADGRRLPESLQTH